MPANGQEFIQYTIQPGDNLWDLAEEYGTTVDDIMAANPGIDPYNLQVGQIIWIDPPRGGYRGGYRGGFRGGYRGYGGYGGYRPYFRPYSYPYYNPYFSPYSYPYWPYY